MMNIKDACHYSNKLTEWIKSLENVLMYGQAHTRITRTHLRSQAVKGMEDETIEDEVNRIFTGQIHNLVFLTKIMIVEKAALSLAIEQAKKDLMIDFSIDGVKQLSFDAAISYNKSMRTLASNGLSQLLAAKPSKTKTTGRGFTFNVEGNQVAFTYEVEVDTKLDYDKNIVAEFNRATLRELNIISTLIDQAQVKNVIDFTPRFEVISSLEDVIADYEIELELTKKK